MVRYLVREGNNKSIIRYTFRLANIISVKGAPLLLATGEILYGFRGRLVWDESETVSSFNRWSFGERRATHPQFEAESSSIHW